MSIWSDIWELFFPRYCAVCGKRLSPGEEQLCVGCLSGLPRTRIHLQGGNEVEKAFWGRFPLERASAWLRYAKGGDVRELLYGLKYHGNRPLGVFLGKCMAAEMLSSGFFEGIDVLVPVPLHPKKKRIRGYNQSEVLAEGVSQVTGIPLCADVLIRTQYTETQTHKSRYGRLMNGEEVFACPDSRPLEGKHILLIDDVMTTGATLTACADVLKGIKDIRISILALAVAGD